MKTEFIYNGMPIKLSFKDAVKEVLQSKHFVHKLKAKLDNNDFPDERREYATNLYNRRVQWIETLESYIESFGK